MASTAFALVLFDVDGCTAIVETKKLVLEGNDLVRGLQCHMKLGTEKLNVEILQISDSKRELNKFEDDWSTSHRSIALDQEKKKRRNQPNGYLSVWPEDMEDVGGEEVQPASVEQTPGNSQPDEAVPNRKTKGKTKEKTGSKGRKITVLHEGSGDYSADTTSPKRAPCFLEEINGDERDLINLQIRQHQEGLRNVAVQTETVVVLGTEDILPPLLAETFSSIMKTLGQMQKEQQTTRGIIQDLMGAIKTLKENQPSRPSLGGLLSTSDLPELTINTSVDMPVDTVQELEDSLSTKLPQRTNEPDTVTNRTIPSSEEPLPRIVRKPRTTSTTQNKTATHSTPLPTSTATNSEHINTASAIETSSSTNLSTPSTTTSSSSATTSTTTVSNQHSPSITSSPSVAIPTSPSTTSILSTFISPPSITSTSSSTTTQSTTSATTSISNTPPTSSFSTINLSQAAAILPSSMLESSPSPSTNKKTIQLNCFDGPIVEIDGPQDVDGTPEDAEFRIRQKTLMSASSTACSKANFGWILTRIIYRKEELVGRNFSGNRKHMLAISPRRRHAIEHAVAEVYGSNEANLKEVISGINTGLRRMRSKRLPFTSLENI